MIPNQKRILEFFKTKTLLLMFCFIFALPVRSEATPTHEASPAPSVEFYQVDPRFEPSTPLNQKNTPTCYGHTATFALQYLLNSESHSTESPQTEISVIDVLGRGNDLEFRDGGSGFKILHRLKNQEVWTRTDLDLEHVWDFKKAWLKNWADHPNTPSHLLLKKALPESLKSQIPHWQSLKQSANLPVNPIQFPYRFIEAAFQPKKIKLPSFNLHVFDPHSPDLRQLMPEGREGAKKEETLISAVELWFKSQGNSAVPMNLGMCVGAGITDDYCENVHSFSIVGVLKECSLNSECSHSWRLRTTWGGEGEGWFDATEVARRALISKSEFYYSAPCRADADSEHEGCTDEILGFSLGGGPQNQSSSHQSSPFLSAHFASHPLHYSIQAGDETLFIKYTSKLKELGTLDDEVRKASKNGKTLGHFAVEHRAQVVLRWLAQNYPEILKQDGETIGNSAFWATAVGNYRAIKELMDLLPELFMTRDDFGLLPSDTRISEPVELAVEIFRLNLQYTDLKRGGKLTPLGELLKYNKDTVLKVRASMAHKPRGFLDWLFGRRS